MASATLSALAGSLLSPLREVSLEKLIGFLWDYLSSSPSPSSPDEAKKQQQLKDSLEALEDAKLTVRSMQSRIMKLFQKHKQNERVVGLHNKLKDVGYDIQDLESEMNYMELERKVHEINKAKEEEEEGDSTSSQFSRKRSFPFRLPTAFLSMKKRRLPASSQSSSLSTDEDIVRQVTSIVKQIKSIESKLKEETMLEELFDQIKLNGVYDPREHHFTQNERVTTSSTNERKIYGRNDEIQRLIEFLIGSNVNNVSVKESHKLEDSIAAVRRCIQFADASRVPLLPDRLDSILGPSRIAPGSSRVVQMSASLAVVPGTAGVVPDSSRVGFDPGSTSAAPGPSCVDQD